MERRELLGALGGLTIAGMATTAIATEPPDVTDHSRMFGACLRQYARFAQRRAVGG